MRLTLVVGARPNYMKIAPIMKALARYNHVGAVQNGAWFEPTLIHTGQHYDEVMNDSLFRDLDLEEPNLFLGVGSGTHAVQTARALAGLEEAFLDTRPDLVVVPGDVNSTLAAALAAVKLHVPVAHVEAGLRSRDTAMPEEWNRVLTDQISDLLFVTSEDAIANLIGEGIADDRIFFVGNPMIDSLEACLPVARRVAPFGELGIVENGYALVTLHRPSNVDDPHQLRELVDVLIDLSTQVPVVFPLHPRTRLRLEERGLLRALESSLGVRLTDPLGYLVFLGLLASSRLVLTDSGGVQEETTVLGIPCLTLRTSTERPITVTQGTNRLVDPYDHSKIAAMACDALHERGALRGRRPALWDGHAAERIVEVLSAWRGPSTWRGHRQASSAPLTRA